MKPESPAMDAAEKAALDTISDGKNHWEVAHAVIEAYEAAKPVAAGASDHCSLHGCAHAAHGSPVWTEGTSPFASLEAARSAEGAEAWLIIYRNGRRSIVDAAKYDASSDAFWINAEAKVAAQVTPLYAHPNPEAPDV